MRLAALSAAMLALHACSDDATSDADQTTCDASQPIRIDGMPAGFGESMRVSTVGSTVYINVFQTDGMSGSCPCRCCPARRGDPPRAHGN